MKRLSLLFMGLLGLAACSDGGDAGPGMTAPEGGPSGPRADASSGQDGGARSDGGDGAPDAGGDPMTMPPARGANLPWDEYEAEASSTNGTILEASTTVGDMQAEASGRRAVRLDETGEYVELTATRAASSIVVRYAIPDAPTGGGIDGTLSVYVDGVFRHSLPLTSRYTWSYGLESWLNGGPNNPSDDPAASGAFHFFDESRALIGEIPAGAKVRLQKDASDAAEYIVIDLIDLEQVAPPLEAPSGFLSITADCGAVADDGADDGSAIQSCVARARDEQKGVWIPEGVFEVAYDGSRDMGIQIAGVTVQGAGMWYSVLHGPGAGFYCSGNDCRFADFAIFGDTRVRDGQKRNNGFNGSAGTGSRLDRIWVEHREVGFWVGLDAPPNGTTDGLVISESRFRNLFADGVNFCNGTSNSEVIDSHFRSTGDDALAVWAYTQPGAVASNNVFHHNTVQLPWRANCFAIYGGSGNRIEDNTCYDTLTFPGIQVGGPYPQHAFAGTTSVRRNTLVRAGGVSFGQQHGALKLFSYDVDLIGVVVRDIDIERPTYFGLDFQSGADGSTIAGPSIERVRITSPGSHGLHVRGDAQGSATLGEVTVTTPGAGGLLDDGTDGHFTLNRGEGNVGW
jgi:hypothetical protein